MRKVIIGIALAAGLAFVSSAFATAATKNYDCSKAGNASKAACKASAKVQPTRAAPVTRTTTTASKTTTTSRNYDCTKAGNANKAACKTAAAQTTAGKTAGAVKTTTKTTSTTVDCTKWYNKVHAQCRTVTASSPAKTTIAPAPKPTPAPSRSLATATENNNPTGATALCKDGTYSHAKTHQGSCSRHGGVVKWM